MKAVDTLLRWQSSSWARGETASPGIQGMLYNAAGQAAGVQLTPYRLCFLQSQPGRKAGSQWRRYHLGPWGSRCRRWWPHLGLLAPVRGGRACGSEQGSRLAQTNPEPLTYGHTNPRRGEHNHRQVWLIVFLFGDRRSGTKDLNHHSSLDRLLTGVSP